MPYLSDDNINFLYSSGGFFPAIYMLRRSNFRLQEIEIDYILVKKELF